MAKKQKISWEGTICTIEYPTIGKKIVVDISKHAAEVRARATIHGYTQCYGDSASGGTPQEKYEMCMRRKEAHENGSWELDTRQEDLTIVLEAVARVKDEDVEDVRAALEEKYDTEEKQATRLRELRADPRVKAAIADIRAERAAKLAENTTGELEV